MKRPSPLAGISSLRKNCLLPLKGDGPNALAVGRSIRAMQAKFTPEHKRYPEKVEQLADKLRAARYRDWKTSRPYGRQSNRSRTDAGR